MNMTAKRKIDNFFAQYPVKKLRKGQIIVSADSNPDGIYHLLKGQIRQYDITNSGEEVVLNVYKPPAFFPMSWAINQMPNRYFFEAFTNAQVQIAPADKVIDFIKSNPDVMYDLISRIYLGMDGVLKRMALLMGANSINRIKFELSIQAKRFGKLQPDGSYILDLHENELAHRAGLTRETVNRDLKTLKKMNLVKVDHRKIIVTDIKLLEDKLVL